jgi:hypothetical protein
VDGMVCVVHPKQPMKIVQRAPHEFGSDSTVLIVLFRGLNGVGLLLILQQLSKIGERAVRGGGVTLV